MTRFARAAGFLGTLAALIVAGAGEASACAICLSAVTVTIGQQLDAADQVVLAEPLPDGQRCRVVAAIKGDLETGAVFTAPALTEPLLRMSFDGPAAVPGPDLTPADRPFLLLRNSLSEQWTSLGAIGARHADWLRRLVERSRGSDAAPPAPWPLTTVTWSTLSDEEWVERMVLVEPYLESEEPLAAEIAYGELARAPYDAMRRLEPVLDVRKVRAWVADPELAPRHSGYLLLLGIAGGPDDAAMLERRMDEARSSDDATDLAAMLAADLELQGPSRIAWVEETYLTDGERTVAEIEAALLALSVHGRTNGAIPRQRIVDAFRLFIRERPPMAAFVAQDLADWEAWDAVPDYLDLIRSGAVQDAAAQFAIVAYLRQKSNAAAEAALTALAAAPAD